MSSNNDEANIVFLLLLRTHETGDSPVEMTMRVLDLQSMHSDGEITCEVSVIAQGTVARRICYFSLDQLRTWHGHLQRLRSHAMTPCFLTDIDHTISVQLTAANSGVVSASVSLAIAGNVHGGTDPNICVGSVIIAVNGGILEPEPLDRMRREVAQLLCRYSS